MGHVNAPAGTGLYEVIEECFEKASDGHKLYRVRCRICGQEFQMKKADYLKKKQCQHVSADGRMIGTPIKWQNPRLGKIFRAMKQRCYNKNNKDYPSDGQRGIRICDEWLEHPQPFEEWALAHEYRDDLTIDRKDSNGNYEPGNCRWIPRSENTKYKGSTQIFRVGEVEHTGREWASICCVGCNTINKIARVDGAEVAEKFIQARLERLEHPEITLASKNQSWLDAYANYI